MESTPSRTLLVLAIIASTCFGHATCGRANIIKSILEFIKGQTEGPTPWEDPDTCIISMQTVGGGNCKASVECDSVKKEYNDWNVCYVDGRQFFTDDRIGDFSIKFIDGDNGLGSPILQLKDINDFKELDVDSISVEEGDGDSDALCRYDVSLSDQQWEPSDAYRWFCAVPKTGKAIGDLDSNAEIDPDIGYATGQCGVHVIHYQIPEGPNNFYSIEATIKDANENQIGEISITTATGPINISSKLPYQLVVTTALPGSVPDTDAEPVSFAYGGDLWNSGDQTRCSVGNYDSGARNMDCGFAC